jgi:hypothetical protein
MRFSGSKCTCIQIFSLIISLTGINYLGNLTTVERIILKQGLRRNMSEGVNWIQLAKERFKHRPYVDTVTKSLVPKQGIS